MKQSDGKKDQFVSLGDEEGVKKIVVDSILKLWDLVNNLTRLRPTKQERFRVTIFGSARAQPGSFAYEQVRKIAKELALMGCSITTGGGPGLMQAANEGAKEASVSESVGIRIELPFEQDPNIFVTQLYEHKTFFTRLHHFVLASDAFVIVPGGIGTTLEALMVWQLLQVKHIKEAPLIFVGKMWEGFLSWTKDSFLRPRLELADSKDLEIPVCVETADEVIEILRKHHAAWVLKNS